MIRPNIPKEPRRLKSSEDKIIFAELEIAGEPFLQLFPFKICLCEAQPKQFICLTYIFF